MLCIAEVDMANSVAASDINAFLTNAAWTICSTYHTILKASPSAVILCWDMLFDILLLTDWHKIGEHRQHQTERNTEWENCSQWDWDYKVGDQVLLRKMLSFAKVKDSMKVIIEPSHQVIQMGLSGLNVEQNWSNSTSEVLHLFSTITLISYYCFLMQHLPIHENSYALHTILTDSLVHYGHFSCRNFFLL
jgi:hypothetical protein